MFKMELGFNPYDKANSNAEKRYANSWNGLQEQFLNSFNLNAGHIFCYNGDPRRKISSMKHTNDLVEVRNANENSNSDAYFYVNGGRKQYAIKTISCCFVDIDAGRDDAGNYLPSKEVMKFKQSSLDKINNFRVKPSWVVDTRNGYQIYWILDDQSRTLVNQTTWNGIQKKLVNYFGGDARAIKINQIYRVPYTWWRKCWEKKASYFTSILTGSSGRSVNVQDLIFALNGQPATVTIVPNATSDAWFEKWRKTYKKSDENGIPVSVDAAQKILNELSNSMGRSKPDHPQAAYTNCCQKNSVRDDAHKILNELSNQRATYTNSTSDTCGQKNSVSVSSDKMNNVWAEYDEDKDCGIDLNNIKLDSNNNYIDNFPKKNNYEKVYGDPSPVLPSHAGDNSLVLNGEQAKLLKTVVEYLNQASTALYFSNNRFLSGAARDLASQISDKFCVG